MVLRLARHACLAAGLLLCAAGAQACGSDDGEQTPGGVVRVASVGPSYFDPALIRDLQSVEPLQLVHLPLTTYRHVGGARGAQIVPGLARSLPRISEGGRVYEFRLRRGARYSDGTPVRADDFEFAIKRTIRNEGPFSTFYTGIVGAAAYADGDDPGADIRGIDADQRAGTVRVELDAPDGKFLDAISQPAAAPVPAAKSKLGRMVEEPPLGAGPYKLAIEDPERSFTLTRNRFFEPSDGVPRGEIDRFEVAISKNVDRMTQEVIRNRADFMTEDPVSQLAEVRDRYGDRFREDANPPNTYYFFLNATVAPFDDLKARQAVNHAIDSRALVRLFGGRLEPGCTFLPPGVPGHREGDCPYGDPAGPGDLDRARDLVRRSGTEGEKVVVWAPNKAPAPAVADYYVGVLDKIGYRAERRAIDDAIYFERVGQRSTKAQTGLSNWYQDFPHPAAFFQPLLSSQALDSEPTANLGFTDDAAVSRRIRDLARRDDLDAAKGGWADLDAEVVGPDKAYLVPYGYEKATSFFSEKMDFDRCAGVHPVFKNDWLQFCEK